MGGRSAVARAVPDVNCHITEQAGAASPTPATNSQNQTQALRQAQDDKVAGDSDALADIIYVRPGQLVDAGDFG
jgi:hypothetical protein